ncbi:MAG: roadblock/LC7 domain-containing protein [Candidatus Helarchaeota archaeon]
MVDKNEIEKVLGNLMDTIPEIEGLICAEKGKVLIGQTLTESMDKQKIAESCISILENGDTLSKTIEKGGVKEINVRYDDGYTVIVGSPDLVFIALTGNDAAPSLGLIQRNLRLALPK